VGRLEEEGLLVRVDRSVYRLAGSAPGWRQDLRIQLLAAGPSGFVCRRSAARVWGLDEPAGSRETDLPPEVAVAFPACRRSGRVARISGIPVDAIVPVGGVPVTDICWTLMTMGATASTDAVELALESALRRKLVRLDDLVAAAADVRCSGLGRLRTVLARRPPGAPATESAAETLLLQIARRARLPDPERQVPVQIGGRRIRLDAGWPALRLAVEVDGREVHDGGRLSEDLRRQNGIVLGGWLHLRFSASDVMWRPEAVRADLVQAYTLCALRTGRAVR
jgi:very-short-patch-repair endonuclease